MKHLIPVLASACTLSCLSSLSSFAQTTYTRPADSFVDSVGVNVHTWYNDTAYARFDELLKPKLQELGIRHIREGVGGTSLSAAIAQKLMTLYTELGIRTTLVIPNLSALQSALPQVGTCLAAVEGPNEPDLIGAGQYTNAQLITLQGQIYSTTKAYNNSIPVLIPSFTTAAGFSNFGVQPADAGNIHNYPGGGPVDSSFDYCQLCAHAAAPAPKPFYSTETGYYTLPDGVMGIGLNAHAKYMPRLYLEYFRRGIPRTFTYEFLDEWSATNPNLQGGKESNFGLIKVNGAGASATYSDKPAFLALKAMLALLKDTQPKLYTPAGLTFRITNADVNVRHLLLRKGDGTFWLVIWQNVNNYNLSTQADVAGPTQNITLNFQQAISTVSVYEPKPSNSFSATSTVASATGPTSMNLTLTDYPLYCKITASDTGALAPQVFPVSTGAGDVMLTSDVTFAKVLSIANNYSDNRVGDDVDAAGGWKTIIKMPLPPAPIGKRVASASLGLYFLSKTNNPSHGVEAIGYIPGNDFGTAADWSLSGSNLGTVLTTTSAAGAVTLQGTALRDFLRSAYSSGQKTVAVRLQLSGGVNRTGVVANTYDFYKFATSRNSDATRRPVLSFTWEDIPNATTQSNIIPGTYSGTLISYSPFTSATQMWTAATSCRAGDEGTNQAYRCVFRFPVIPPSGNTNIHYASIRVRRNNIIGSPGSIRAKGFVTTQTGVALSDWAIPSQGTDLGIIGTPGAAEGFVELVVTDLARQALATSGPTAAAVGLHVSLDGGFFLSGGTSYDSYTFGTSLTSVMNNRPVITIVSSP